MDFNEQFKLMCEDEKTGGYYVVVVLLVGLCFGIVNYLG